MMNPNRRCPLNVPSNATRSALAPNPPARTSRTRANTCPHGSDCPRLLGRLRALDFSLAETILYLDAYPESKRALAHYHKLLSERDQIKESLAQSCRPVTAYENLSQDSWDWIKGPWPWENAANESLKGED